MVYIVWLILWRKWLSHGGHTTYHYSILHTSSGHALTTKHEANDWSSRSSYTKYFPNTIIGPVRHISLISPQSSCRVGVLQHKPRARWFWQKCLIASSSPSHTITVIEALRRFRVPSVTCSLWSFAAVAFGKPGQYMMHTDKVACHLKTLFSNLLALMVKDLVFHRRTVPGTWIIIYLMMLLQVDLVPQGTGQMTSRLLSRVRDKPSGNFAQTARSYDVLRFIRCMEYAFI